MEVTPPSALAALMQALTGEKPTGRAEAVILLHGLGRTANSLFLLEWRLRQLGYDVVNVNYPSTILTIEDLADQTLPAAIDLVRSAERFHIVTHSMGGILLRQFATTHDLPENFGHCVMLGPPNQGTEIVDQLRDLPTYELWNGQAGTQLGTGPDSLPRQLGPVSFSCGVIAGTQSVSPILSQMIDGPNDGKVSVSSTKVDGMADHITLPVTHTFMMNSAAVLDQICHFLKSGRFAQEGELAAG